MNFCDLEYINRNSKLYLKRIKQHDLNTLEIKYKDNGVFMFEFCNQFSFEEVTIIKASSFELRFYFRFLIPLKFKFFDYGYNSLNAQYQYAKFFLNMYSYDGRYLGHLPINPNSNNMFSVLNIENYLLPGVRISDVSYLKISVTLLQQCHFFLSNFVFYFVDFMSTNIIYYELLNCDFRFMINNFKKKKNGVLIFFPSFYVHGKNTDFPANVDHSVKWPNFTRYSWAENLRDYCTVFIADPLQFLAGNEKSSWFIDHKGNSLLPAIAYKIKDMLGLNDGTCGPIINYGSSMGGYAAFLFSCYLKPDLCFAECPQANLTKYKYSLEYLKQYPELDYQKDIYNCLSFSKIIKEHKPEFKSLFHFYALDKLHLDNFNSEISKLSEDEIKKFNYSLVVENDAENDLHGHQAMPKEKVLEIFHRYLK